MAKRPPFNDARRNFGVAVVGLSGTERDKGLTGVGKSCLCNRFVRPHAEDYERQHLSVLSQSDFGGRVVNNDHFLYWGRGDRVGEDGIEYDLEVVEQTEFIDDSSFQSFRIGKTEPYHKRCAATKLVSAEKLAYVCKDQLGLEEKFLQQMMPDGRQTVDGFLCVFDVSIVEQRPIQRQVDFTCHILCTLLKTKRPVVLVTTKNDQAHKPYVREAENLLGRKELKNSGIMIVETSAHENVNVDSAFMLLAQLMDKSFKARQPKPVLYIEAAQAFNEQKTAVTERFLTKLRTVVKDYQMSWTKAEKSLNDSPEFHQFLHLCGSMEARTKFSNHIVSLKQEKLRGKKKEYSQKLANVLQEIFPTLQSVEDRSWTSICQCYLPRLENFEDYFSVLPSSWDQEVLMDHNGMTNIPFDWLKSSEAETVFRNHVNALWADFRRNELKREFKTLLDNNQTICPGKKIVEVEIFLMDQECFNKLTPEDKKEVYEQHQEELQERCKAEFLELLQEKAEVFFPLQQVALSGDDLSVLREQLRPETRYQALRCLAQEREQILLTHIGFIQSPSPAHCPYQERCMDKAAHAVLARRAQRPQSWSKGAEFLIETEDSVLNLVILGAQGLSHKLQREIQDRSVGDEYLLDGKMHALTIRPVSGNVSLPENMFTTPTFQPHGCLCVYNSLGSLDYLHESLDKTLTSADVSYGGRRLQGLPIVLVLAHNLQLTQPRQLSTLRARGKDLADRFQCRFVDIPSSMMQGRSDLCYGEQIDLALHHLLDTIRSRSQLVRQDGISAESLEPDLRILMAFMCGEPFNLELPLAPLLNHQCCYLTHDRLPTINLETYLGDAKQKLEITVTSYHEATQVLHDLFHGYILVYSVHRRASLSNLKAFGQQLPTQVPVKVLAVTEESGASAFFSDSLTQTLFHEGNNTADNLGASFMTTCKNFSTQSASYSPFFKECWDRKETTETQFSFGPDSSAETPLQITDIFSTNGRSSMGSNHGPDGDSIYDRPYIACPSDSDHDSLPRSTKANPYASVPIINGHQNTSGDNISHHSHHSSAEPTPPTTLQKSNYNEEEYEGKNYSSPARSLFRKPHPVAQIEIDGDYGTVKDALLPQPESDYAEVADCLPKGQRQRIRASREHPGPSFDFEGSLSLVEITSSDTLGSNASKASDDDASEQSSLLTKFSNLFSDTKRKKGKGKGVSKEGTEYSVATGEMMIEQQLSMFTAYVEHNGLGFEGLYRIPGNKAVAHSLLQQSRDDPSSMMDNKDYQVTAVTTALKQLIMEMPQPLIPLNIKNCILTAMKGFPVGPHRTTVLQAHLGKLPESNRKILHHLAVHLNKVAEHSDLNKMSPSNLSTCWWPTILQCNFNTMEDFQSESKHWEAFVQEVIENPSHLLSWHL